MPLDRNSGPESGLEQHEELLPSFGSMARQLLNRPPGRGALPAQRGVPGPATTAYQQVLRSTRALWATVGTLIAVRLVLLPWTPPGFFGDEAAIGAQTKALAAHGTDAYGNSWPLFFHNLGDTSSGLYIYPAALWVKIFGGHEISLRYFSQFLTIAAILVLAGALRLWLGAGFALLAAAVALAMPWGWLQGSIAWDDVAVPIWEAMTFLAYSTLLLSAGGRRARRAALVGLPLAATGSAYIYPPVRAAAPLMLLVMVVVLRRRDLISRRERTGVFALAGFVALPLVHMMIQPGANARTMTESVFHDNSIWGGLVAAVSNLWGLVNPAFLFLSGDANLRHSTGRQGMLGIVSILPVIALLAHCVRRAVNRPRGTSAPLENEMLLIVVAASCAGFGLLGSALTATGQPHSLRATAAWPYLAILLALGWRALLQRVTPNRIVALTTLFALTTGAYAADLATGYRTRSAEWFDVTTRARIQQGLPVNQWDLTMKYYGRG
jgi:hypothetical protein